MADGSGPLGVNLVAVQPELGFGFHLEVNSTFQGQSQPFFLGLIPVLTIFDELEGGDC